jgi:type IV secretory pathway VirB10-like protein
MSSRAKRSGRPLLLVGAVLVIVAFLVVWVALEKGQQTPTKDATDHGGSATDFASQVVGDRTGYVKPLVVAAPVPAPTPAPAVTSATPDAELESRQKAFYGALFAQSAVPLPQPVVQQQGTVAPDEAARAIPVGTPGDFPAVAGVSPAPRDPNSLATYNGTKDRWTLNNRPEPPVSPYVLQTGSVIPALLISGMESELPGTIVAQVSQDVFDSPTGEYLLIPQGAKLIGEYWNMIQYGQARIFVAWQRIVFPNGWTFDISAEPGVDGQGEAGLRDQVNTHLLSTIGSALLMSLVSAGAASPGHGK